jgi:sigma-B regulation protein RsbU (phosphoserine phosphatase)
VLPLVETINVLLIEDNPGDARLYREMLAEARDPAFELQWVDRLSKGLERLADGNIHLVLVDLTLPDSQGLETFLRVHAHAPGIAIVVLSGLADEMLAFRTVQEGAQDYLVKGQVEGPLLVRAARYAIERKQAQEALARYAGELRERNEQMEQELRMARELQLALLPQQFPSIPRGAPFEESRLRFFSVYRPWGTISGDFFDVMPLSDTAVGVLVCDVMGHDVRAALITAMIRAQLEDLAPARADPGTLLTEMNRRLYRILQHAGTTMYATACYVVADVERGDVLYGNAGHPDPLHLRRGSRAVELLHAEAGGGPALGLFEDATYGTNRRAVAPDDLLLLFTDGLFEVEGPNAERYTHERLIAAVRKLAELAPADLVTGLVGEIQRFSGSGNFSDDVCLVACELARLS